MVRDGGRRPKISVDVLRADLAEARLEARELGEENTQLRDELSEALAKVHELGAKYGSPVGDSVVRKAKAHAADQREHIKRLEKEIHMLNSKGRMMEVQCDMLTQQEDELRKSFDTIITWLGFLGVALVLAGIVEWAGVTNLVGEHLARRFKRMCDASCESRIEIIKSCPS